MHGKSLLLQVQRHNLDMMTAPDVVEAPLPASEAPSSDALSLFRRRRSCLMQERIADEIKRVESYVEQTVIVPDAAFDMLRLLYDAIDMEEESYERILELDQLLYDVHVMIMRLQTAAVEVRRVSLFKRIRRCLRRVCCSCLN